MLQVLAEGFRGHGALRSFQGILAAQQHLLRLSIQAAGADACGQAQEQVCAGGAQCQHVVGTTQISQFGGFLVEAFRQQDNRQVVMDGVVPQQQQRVHRVGVFLVEHDGIKRFASSGRGSPCPLVRAATSCTLAPRTDSIFEKFPLVPTTSSDGRLSVWLLETGMEGRGNVDAQLLQGGDANPRLDLLGLQADEGMNLIDHRRRRDRVGQDGVWPDRLGLAKGTGDQMDEGNVIFPKDTLGRLRDRDKILDAHAEAIDHDGLENVIAFDEFAQFLGARENMKPVNPATQIFPELIVAAARFS